MQATASVDPGVFHRALEIDFMDGKEWETKVYYSHRNGETEPPERHGWYWVAYEQHGIVLYTMNYMGAWGWSEQVGSNLVGYYGPIPQPTRKE